MTQAVSSLSCSIPTSADSQAETDAGGGLIGRSQMSHPKTPWLLPAVGLVGPDLGRTDTASSLAGWVLLRPRWPGSVFQNEYKFVRWAGSDGAVAVVSMAMSDAKPVSPVDEDEIAESCRLTGVAIGRSGKGDSRRCALNSFVIVLSGVVNVLVKIGQKEGTTGGEDGSHSPWISAWVGRQSRSRFRVRPLPGGSTDMADRAGDRARSVPTSMSMSISTSPSRVGQRETKGPYVDGASVCSSLRFDILV